MRLARVCLLAVLLAGCSTTHLAYNHADIYLHWRATHYVELDDVQSAELDARIAAFLSWHRSQALPKYAQILDEAKRRFERRLQPADLVWGYDAIIAQAREGLRAAAERIAPLLDRLTPQQIARLERRFAEDNRRFARENLRGGDRERRRRRTERDVERLEDWVGELSRAQVERVAQYAERAPLLDEFRDREHRRLQAEFLAIVRARQAQKRLPDFVANWDRGRESAYVAALEAARREYFAMVLDLQPTLAPEQRRRVAAELGRYAEDFRALARSAR